MSYSTLSKTKCKDVCIKKNTLQTPGQQFVIIYSLLKNLL